MVETFGLMFNLYYMFDYECNIEAYLHDLSNFCFEHDCRMETLFKNEMENVFAVTGSLNALAAIFSDEAPVH